MAMSVPLTTDEFLALVYKSEVTDSERLAAFVAQRRGGDLLPADTPALGQLLVNEGLLTYFQMEQLLQGKWRGFTVGKYKILERIGSGGMGVVYLAEHKFLHRLVAVKVLPVVLAQDPWFLDFFYREAQAIAALDHANIVHAHDVDQDGNLHFLVMEYVDGNSLQTIVSKSGPMDFRRVPHYMAQAARGLQHAHEAGIVHRDIKPANLLLERRGLIKILDMGLAHFFAHAPADWRAKQDMGKRIVGTDDYLAPEQIVDSDNVDIRADIYSLGDTAYFLLTGNPPFHHVARDDHKLMSHLLRTPRAIRECRPEVPEELAAIFSKMMAKNPWERYRLPKDAVTALEPWTRTPIPPPPENEMPGLSPAARRSSTPGGGSSASRRAGRSSWVVLGNGQGTGSGLLSGVSEAQQQAKTDTPATARSGDTTNQPGSREAQ
jgi:serine/threonine protein kinase